MLFWWTTGPLEYHLSLSYFFRSSASVTNCRHLGSSVRLSASSHISSSLIYCLYNLVEKSEILQSSVTSWSVGGVGGAPVTSNKYIGSTQFDSHHTNTPAWLNYNNIHHSPSSIKSLVNQTHQLIPITSIYYIWVSEIILWCYALSDLVL